MACCHSTARLIENIPILGHIMAACYACSGNRAKAERAAIKSTVGIVLAPVNIVAEAIDEATRNRSERLKSRPLQVRSNWMKRQHRKTLKNICLPGSHSSGMFKITHKYSRWPFVDGWALCQKLDVYHQLLGGIRFLDLRLVTFEGTISVTDDVGLARGASLTDILAGVKRFVTENSSEIVVIHLSDGEVNSAEAGDRSSSKLAFAEPIDWKTVNMLVQDQLRKRLIPEIMRDLTIGDIVDHGKNVVVCGAPVAISAYSWQQFEVRQPNVSNPAKLRSHLESTLEEMTQNRSASLFWYRAECTAQSAQYAHNSGGVAGLVAGRYNDTDKFEFLEDLASAANSGVLQVLIDTPRLPFNILSTDYVHDDVIGRIVHINEAMEAGRYVSVSALNMDETVLPDEVDDRLFNGTHNASLSSAVQRRMLNASSIGSSGLLNTSSFDIRHQLVPPIQIRDTSV